MTAPTVRTYSGWRGERIGLMFGLTLWQVFAVMVAFIPVPYFLARQLWGRAVVWLLVWALATVAIAVPIVGRPAVRWLVDLVLHAVARVFGVSAWQSTAAAGALTAQELGTLDLPGALQRLRVHDGPPLAHQDLRRPVLLQDAAAGGSWRMVARMSHQGLSLTAMSQRDGFAENLGGMLGNIARARAVRRLSIYIRTVPEDGAARWQWHRAHLTDVVSTEVRSSLDQLEAQVIAGSVRHEIYVVVTVEEKLLRREGKAAGGGVEGRARAMYRLLPEVENNLTLCGCEDIEWLTTEGWSEAIATGYDPSQVVALAAARTMSVPTDATLYTGTDLAAAAPALMPPPRPSSYVHGLHQTASYTILLPELGTQVGRLAPLLTPSTPGERRTLALHYEPVPIQAAQRQVDRDITSAEMAEDARRSRGFRTSSRSREQSHRIRRQEQILSRGHSLVRVAGVAAVTAPTSGDFRDHGQALESNARSAGFALQRLELAQDVGFVAGVLPVGLGLPSRGGSL